MADYGHFKDSKGNKKYINDDSIYHEGKNLGEVINSKQDKLTAGTGIVITGENTINNIQGNYSTEEVKIGTWIDGKPLYRKVIIINNIALNKGENTIAHGISNIDKGIKISCFNYSGIVLPYINLNADSSLKTATFITGINSTNIFFRVVNDSWGAQNNWCVIMEYTKTTD